MQVNEFVKRVRAAKIHILIMGHLRKQMPAMMGKQKAQEKLLRNLADQFAQVQREYHLPVGDFPDVNRCAHFSCKLALCTDSWCSRLQLLAVCMHLAVGPHSQLLPAYHTCWKFTSAKLTLV